ncbi:MAG TPA: caa(3)-type oxidase subunit IV [Candidatus Lambdaproteobacteria bacterium]|jgi:caa(3)-type oxidase subunit IV|nr:cytochrome C oxidase subunit IV family protein [SAR324 cluster bacterium]HBL54382.1 caa(3)-type oxidase subunit IV [Deltaproteobacteria bacterium]HHZ79418.1 caa(3)-type oxidase subunit IV [Candidatus Lambdaproteobacteria bacterium]HIA58077.1 caa(3)-type oxidase subunit IV [Candidatus Lambdaproteobacteria bacterium]HIB45118.1 caa(3)-type oxidase subunit IV [Candidatus Lambdaproteobacteria bacterium]
MSEAYAHPNYVKIWIWLLVLLGLSVSGPMLEIPTLTIITAFGIAVVKAFLVAANFMHLKFEKKIIWFLLIMCFCMLGVFFFGVAPDIMMTEGDQWIDCIADKSCVEQRL